MSKLSAFLGKELYFLLLFSCSQDPSTEISEDKDFFDEFKEIKINVADYPAANAFSEPDVARALQLDPDITYSARKLAVAVEVPPKADKCGCKKKSCASCSCAKQSFYCMRLQGY